MSTTAEPWRDTAGPLRELANQLGLDVASLWRSESRDALNFTQAAVPHFPERPELDNVLRQLVVKYDGCVDFTVSEGEVVRYSVDPAYSATDVGEVYESIDAGATLDLHIGIDKIALLAKWGLTASDCAFALFLFPEALEHALAVPLTTLEEEDGLLHGFAEKQRLIVLVPDREIELSGGFLAVLGGNALARWREHLPAPRPADPRPETVMAASRKLLKWVHYELRTVTPLHLELDWKSTPPANDDPIALWLFAQWVTCSLLYLGGLSQRDDDQKKLWLVTFAADKSFAQAEVGEAGIREALAGCGDPWVHAKAIGERVRWAYTDEKQIADRHNVLQYVIADALQYNAVAAENSRELIHRAPELVTRIDVGWQAFTAQKLGKYFEHIRQLEDLVDTTGRGYDEQIQSLSRTLIDNVLAALGVVIGSFLAAMLASPFRPFVFRFGVGVYLLYFVGFPCFVGLLTTWVRFETSRSAFEKRRKDFKTRLSDTDTIVGNTVENCERSFKHWFGGTVLVYAVVTLALVAALILVPDRIRAWSDEFTLIDVDYGRPAAAAVPVIIRGSNFDKDKDIVVMIDSSIYATSAKSVEVYGSSVLRVVVPQTYLPSARDRRPRYVEVRQGSVTKRRALPPFPG